MYTIIGLDGGGTSTKGCIGYNKNNILATSISGGLNPYAFSEEEIIDTIVKSVEMLTSQARCNLEDVDMLCIGAAGLDRRIDQDRFMDIYKRTNLNIPLYMTNDAKTFMHGNLCGQSGILTISGTGSISYGYGNGEYYRQGGYGHLISDEGSGYDMSIRLLKRVFKYKDKNIKTDIENTILEVLGLNNNDELLKWIYQPDTKKMDIASLTKPLVTRLGEDREVINIMDDCADALIKNTVGLYHKMCDAGNRPDHFIINGSVLKNVTSIKNRFVSEVEKQTGMRLREANLPAEVGALELGLSYLKGEVNYDFRG